MLVCGEGWEGSVSQTSTTDCWTFQDLLVNGTNPTPTLKILNSGSSTASPIVSVPALSSSSTISAVEFSGPLVGNVTGNASTATTLAAAPAGCAAGQFSTGIAASGASACAQVYYTQISGTPSVAAAGVIKSNGSVYADAAYSDIVGLFGSGSCSGYLKSDGTCASSTGGISAPGTTTSGYIPTWNSTTGASLAAGVAAPAGTIVGTSDSQTLTNKSIAASEVTSGNLGLTVLPQIAAGTILGNNSGSTGTPIALTAANLNTLLSGTPATATTYGVVKVDGTTITATGGVASFNPGNSLAFTASQSFGSGFALTTTGTQPSCTSGIRGQFWYIQSSAGTADHLQVCSRDSSSNYNWLQIF